MDKLPLIKNVKSNVTNNKITIKSDHTIFIDIVLLDFIELKELKQKLKSIRSELKNHNSKLTSNYLTFWKDNYTEYIQTYNEYKNTFEAIKVLSLQWIESGIREQYDNNTVYQSLATLQRVYERYYYNNNILTRFNNTKNKLDSLVIHADSKYNLKIN